MKNNAQLFDADDDEDEEMTANEADMEDLARREQIEQEDDAGSGVTSGLERSKTEVLSPEEVSEGSERQDSESEQPSSSIGSRTRTLVVDEDSESDRSSGSEPDLDKQQAAKQQQLERKLSARKSSRGGNELSLSQLSQSSNSSQAASQKSSQPPASQPPSYPAPPGAGLLTRALSTVDDGAWHVRFATADHTPSISQSEQDRVRT